MPRYSATAMVWALATCADTSATTAFLSSRLRPTGLSSFQVHTRTAQGRSAPTATWIRSAVEMTTIILFWAHRLRRPTRLLKREQRPAPAVFDDPPRNRGSG